MLEMRNYAIPETVHKFIGCLYLHHLHIHDYII